MNQQIGRYTIVEEIGHGGFAAVFRAVDTTLEREVAVKVMRPLLMSDPEFVARFQREAKVAASLQHPNIIPIYDYGEYEGRLFLVMKLMQDSLAKRLEQGPLPWKQVVALGQHIAAGLDFAHRRGAIHRDIKPDNILLDEQGNALLADFGVVKAMAQSTLTVSMSGGILGTPAYIAPEVWSDQPATPATDVYALACMVYEMVTGRKLFDASTPPATMTLHFQPLQLPARWPNGTPPGLSDVLRRALTQDPAQRTQTAVELIASLTTLTLDPLADRYKALQAALTAETWPDAIALAEAILVQEPTYKDTSTLLQQATTGQMAAQQVIQATQWQEQAEQAIIAENWTMALTAIQRWQQITPNDPVAQQLLDKVNAAQAPTLPPAQTQATPKPESSLPEPSKEKSGVSAWVWAIAGIAIIGLLILGGSQLFGNSVEPNIVGQLSIAPVIAIVNTNTPASTPTITPTNTSTTTSTIIPTKTPTNTPKPTNTSVPTSTNKPTKTPTNTPEPTNTLVPTYTPTTTSIDIVQSQTVPTQSQVINAAFSCTYLSPIPSNVDPPLGSTITNKGSVTLSWPAIKDLPSGYKYGISITNPVTGKFISETTPETQLSITTLDQGENIWRVFIIDLTGNVQQCKTGINLTEFTELYLSARFWYTP